MMKQHPQAFRSCDNAKERHDARTAVIAAVCEAFSSLGVLLFEGDVLIRLRDAYIKYHDAQDLGQAPRAEEGGYHYTRDGYGVIEAVCHLFSRGTFLLNDGDALLPIQNAYIRYRAAKALAPTSPESDGTTAKGAQFLAGYAAALGDLSRMRHISSVEIEDALNGAGLTLDELKSAGADDHDLDELRREIAGETAPAASDAAGSCSR